MIYSNSHSATKHEASCNLLHLIPSNSPITKKDRGCHGYGSDGRVAVSNTRDPGFRSRLHQNYLYANKK